MIQFNRYETQKKNIHISELNDYHLNENIFTWSNAEIYCNDRCDSNLASFHSASDYLSIVDILNDALPFNYGASNNPWSAWSGLNDIDTVDVYTYIDGTPFDYPNDTSSYPVDNVNSSGQRCIHFWSSKGFLLDDDVCTIKKRVVCNQCDWKKMNKYIKSSEDEVNK